MFFIRLSTFKYEIKFSSNRKLLPSSGQSIEKVRIKNCILQYPKDNNIQRNFKRCDNEITALISFIR